MKSDDDFEGAVLVLAPTGKDSGLAVATLGQAEIRAKACADLQELAARCGEATDALLIAQEALVTSELPILLDALARQPAWSDIPLIILTSSGGSDEISLRALEIFGPSANVTLLERPFRVVTLLSTVRVALRARRRQREVRDLLAQRDMVLSSISDAFSALDSEWRYIYLNDRVAEHSGMAREELIGRKIWDVFPQLVGGEFHQRCLRALAQGQPDHFEHFHQEWGRWLETRVYPAADGLVIFRTDITERKRQEKRMRESERLLQESEDRLRLAIEAVDAGTFDFYPQTGDLRWSDRCKRLFGLSPEAEVNYDTFLRGLHPDDRARVDELVASALRPGSDGHFDAEYRTIGIEDGKERWVAVKGLVIFDLTGMAARFIGTVLEITAQKQGELELQRAKQAAEDANRAKDQFLAMLSHELRTPLTPVLMTIAVLRRDPTLSDELQRDLEMLQRNIELEALLIDDLLDLTRIAHGKLELHSDAADLHALIEHALKIAEGDAAGRQLDVVRRFAARHFHTWGDSARLQQVFWNLIKNAVKFTPPGGRIEISTRNITPACIEIMVRDNGVGIEPELLPRIFEAFEQGGRDVTSRFGGLGLGLAICKRVIDLHRGTITAASPGGGQGSTFTITLNAIETSLLDGPPIYLGGEMVETRGAAILLIEDHSDTARVLCRILTKAGYHVELADRVSEARALAAEKSFDLVISDLGLPDGSGLALMRHLSQSYGLRGIALSGFGTDEDLAASRAAGFAEHLTKPVDWDRLKEAIARLTTTVAAGAEEKS
ncbi:MAG TPA: ATP-binding protein [Chthoniobacterales bacterium]|nr:ATP-binding protein [Chthoniobacterales bacterium]